MNIPIYDAPPQNWQDLQVKVAKIYTDIGYETRIEADIPLVRGSVNVDVLCTKKTPLLNEVIIIECKHWNSRVPKTIVHAFRSVIADHGANAGYIISKSGFQEGAYEAIQSTNIRLLTFEEFQSAIRPIWLDAVIDKIEHVGYPLRKYCNPIETFAANEYDRLPATEQKKIDELLRKYYQISLHTMRGLYKEIISGRLMLEYIDEELFRCAQSFPGFQFKCLMDYFDLMHETCVNAVAEFDMLYGKKLRKH
jgi:restriction endonuclease